MSNVFRIWYLMFPAWLFFLFIFGPEVVTGAGRTVMALAITFVWGGLWIAPMGTTNTHSISSFLGVTDVHSKDKD